MSTFFRRILTTLIVVTSAAAVAAEGQVSGKIANNIDSALKSPPVVEFIVTDGADLIDFAGPAEVFNFVKLPGHDGSPYIEYIVSDTLALIKLQGGFIVTPNYTFDTAPPADIVIIGGQSRYSPTQKELNWLRARHAEKQTVMSVCTGAYDLAKAGLLDDKQATTHHDAFNYFLQAFPSVKIVHGKRYVQSDPYLFTAGGLSSGIDLALHMVDMRFGRMIAEHTADTLEYQGTGWLTNTSSF